MRHLLLAVGLWWAGIGSLSAATVLIVGDSISAAYGIDKEQGWVALFEARYASQCEGLRVSNASVSGDTSAGGAARLPALLRDIRPDIVVIELGGNDGLRGLSPQAMEQNLRRMVTLSREAGAVPLLFGMYLPPNYGAA
jgi:acyl-CoA thioesterase I